MKKITFNNILIKNFLSVGDTPLFINFISGINLITGENKDNNSKNGVGKSTILDALYWCLFGNTLRDLKKDKIINNKTKKNGEVVINFSVESDGGVKNYKLERYLEPSKIQIFSDDEDITLSTIASNDDFIKKLIGANEEVFKNAVIMSSENTIPFMAQKKVEKRKFIEGILQLDIFSEMLSKIRSEFNDFKKENDLLSNNFVNLQKNLEIFKKQRENGEEIKKNKILLFLEKIKINNSEIKKLKIENENAENDIKEKIKNLKEKNTIIEKFLDKKQTELKDITNQNTKINLEINQIRLEKNKLTEKGNSCPLCNREFCENDLVIIKDKIEELNLEINKKEKEIETLSSHINSLEKDIKFLNLGLDKIKLKKEEYQNELQKNLILNQKIENLKEKNNEYYDFIKEIKEQKENYDENIKNCDEEIEINREKLSIVKQNLNILESCKFIVSEDGVKTFIIKKIINLLNDKLNFYLKSFDAPCICNFNEFFEESIYNDSGKECSYFNFSGGERKRIDTAILFTFQDVLRFHSGTSYSLNIYDELFDSALDDIGTEKILNILKEKCEKYKESIYIISHKNNTKLNVDNILFLEKTNGFTTLKN
jgi:DNA repair exonuclease SbcCD ATPase subunit